MAVSLTCHSHVLDMLAEAWGGGGGGGGWRRRRMEEVAELCAFFLDD